METEPEHTFFLDGQSASGDRAPVETEPGCVMEQSPTSHTEQVPSMDCVIPQ